MHKCGARNSLKFCSEGKILSRGIILRIFFISLMGGGRGGNRTNRPVICPYRFHASLPPPRPAMPLGWAGVGCSTTESSTSPRPRAALGTNPFPLPPAASMPRYKLQHYSLSLLVHKPKITREPCLSGRTYTDSSYVAQMQASVPITSAFKEVLP